MIEQDAVVVAVNDDLVTLEPQSPAQCSTCATGGGCGAGVFSRLFSNRSSLIHLRSPMPVRVGDKVMVGLSERGLVLASMAMYILPLVLFMLLFACVSEFSDNRLSELWYLFISLVLTLFIYRFAIRRLLQHQDRHFHPVLLRRL